MTMKINLLTTALAGFALATFPLHAEDTATANDTSKSTNVENTANTAKTIPTYLVVFSGAG